MPPPLRWNTAVLLAMASFGFLMPAAAAEKSVSYYHDLVPILKRSCTGCHHPGKLKGELDLTTYAAFLKGGKHGAGFKAGQPTNSMVIEEISGDEPSMPKEGDALTKDEVALFARWIVEGARDDTPANANSFKLAAPPVYSKPPVASQLVVGLKAREKIAPSWPFNVATRLPSLPAV